MNANERLSAATHRYLAQVRMLDIAKQQGNASTVAIYSATADLAYAYLERAQRAAKAA